MMRSKTMLIIAAVIDGLGQAAAQGLPPNVASVQCVAACGSLVAKAGPATLYGFNVKNGDTAGTVLVLNSATVPADGPVTPIKCYDIAAAQTIGASWMLLPAGFVSGISVVLNTGTGSSCFNKVVATGTKLGFISVDSK